MAHNIFVADILNIVPRYDGLSNFSRTGSLSETEIPDRSRHRPWGR